MIGLMVARCDGAHLGGTFEVVCPSAVQTIQPAYVTTRLGHLARVIKPASVWALATAACLSSIATPT